MKVLVVVAHPTMEQSRVNKKWMEEVEKYSNVTVHDLYKAYPDEAIQVEREQALLEEHDRVILQFPFFWYSSPSLLKKWIDSVLTYGWAYGSEGTKLHGKECGLAISTGGPAEAYQAGGYNGYSMSELLKPFQATANLTGMKYMPTFLLQGVRTVSDEDLEQSAKDYARYVTQD